MAEEIARLRDDACAGNPNWRQVEPQIERLVRRAESLERRAKLDAYAHALRMVENSSPAVPLAQRLLDQIEALRDLSAPCETIENVIPLKSSRFFNRHKRDEKHIALVDAASRAVRHAAKTDIDLAYRAAAEALSEECLEMYVRHHRGFLKPAKGAPCLYRLAGRRCQHDDYGACNLPGADHTTFWNLGGQPYAYITHPYQWNEKTCIAAASKVIDMDLIMTIDPRLSWYFPGYTMAVIVHRSDHLAHWRAVVQDSQKRKDAAFYGPDTE